MPNVIREDVVQVSFRSDGVQDILQGKTALKQLEEKAESASDAFASATKSSKKFGEESSESARKSKQSFEELGEEWDKSKETLAEWTERINTAGHRAENLQKMLGKDFFRNLDDDALLDIGESAEKSESAVDDLTESANVLADALSGAAAAFSVGVLLQNVSETQQALNKLQAQTGANASEMESMGEAVKTIYTSGIGESLGEVADTAALVNQQFQDLDTDTMQSITQNAMTMADTFGTDVNETLRGVNALMVNMGLSVEEAFDYIAKGTQNGLDKSNELSDNIAEYSQLWAQAGFSAEEMFTILQNGLDSGAYNLDKVNDFVKEFTISLSDGRMEENIESFSERTQTLFAQWQNGTASQKEVFQSVINDLSTMTNQQEALTLASTVWSALGEDNAMQVITSLNNVNDTYNDVKGTMESINDIRYADIGTSFEQLKRSASGLLTETLTPAVTSLNGLLSTGLESLTAFASEHAALAQGMTVAATAAGVLTVGLIAVSGAIGVVKTALDALNVSTGGVVKIIGLVVTGASALIGIFAGLHAAMADDEAEVEDYAGTLTECRAEIEQTELALKKAKERYGENSATVKSLESDLELLNAQYEKGGGDLGEMQQRVDETAKSFRQMAQAQQETMDSIDRTEISGLQAVSMLEALSQKSELTSADLDAMGKYADYLNDTFQCNIVVDYDTGELTGFDPENIVSQIRSMQDAARSEEAMSYIIGSDFTNSYLDAASEYVESEQKLRYMRIEYEQLLKTGREDFDGHIYYADDNRVAELESEIKEWTATVDENKSVLEEQSAALEENGKIAGLDAKTIRELEDSLMDTARAGEDTASSVENTNESLSETEQGVAAAQDAIDSYSGTLQELCIAYDEARTAALESIQSQFNLWDEVESVAATSTDSLMQSIQSQTDYWTQYNDNLSTLQERSAAIPGLADMLLELNDGSAEAAAALAGLAGASDTELQNVVTAFLNLQQQEQDTSDTMGDVATQFSTKTGEMKSDMEDLATSADMSEQFGSAATSTINAYFDSMMGVINDRRGEVESALASLSSAISSASSASSGLFSPVSLPGHASGTTNAEDIFVAGEQGAELVIGKQGSTVFPASETEKIIRAVQEYADLSGGYQPEQSTSYRYDSQMTTMLAPTFQLYLSGGMSGSNQRQAKQWMQQIVEEMFAGVLRTNPPVYTI